MLGYVVLAVLLCVVNAACPHQAAGLTRWSQWSGAAGLSSNSTVTISASDSILLDISPSIVVEQIDVYGILTFDNAPIDLKVRYLNVYAGGQLWLGSEDCPLTASISVTFYGLTQNPKTLPALENANKVLAAYGGSQIDIHGAVRLPTWTVLSGTVYAGATSITVADPVAWQAGDVIVIATTDFTKRADVGTAPSITTARDATNNENTFQSEVRTITSVTNGGRTVSFAVPLQYMHWGEFWRAPDDPSITIDMRGEVGLLTRNIVFRGDTTEGTTLADHWGGHIMGQDACNMRIEGAEFYAMGQKDNLARYPVHFHECGNATNSYVKRNAFHDTFQRAVTIHGTNNVLVEENVGFNVDGHMYFIEDGNEVGNVFNKNLGVQVNPHTLLKPVDLEPAIFWSTSAANTWTNNVAVAGYLCYWFSLPRHPLGLANVPSYLWWNRYTPIKLFQNNKAHSCTRKGLHIDDGLINANGTTELTSYRPIVWEDYIDLSDALALSQKPPGWGGLENGLETQFYLLPDGESLILNFTSYKNIEHGVWGRGAGITVDGAKLADNQVGAQFPGDNNVIRNSIIVGETANVGTPDIDLREIMQGRSRFYRWYPDCPIIGYQNYDGGSPDIVENVKFYDFVDFHFQFNGKVRKAGGLRVQGGRGVLPPRNRYFNVGFHNTPNHVEFITSTSTTWKNSEPNYVSAVIVDADGSITNECGSSIVYPYSPILFTPQCTNYTLWNAMVCPPGAKPNRHMYITDNTYKGTSYSGTGDEVFYASGSVLYRLPDHASHQLVGNVDQSANYVVGNQSYFTVTRDYYQVNALMFTSYLMVWGSQQRAPESATFTVNYASKDEWVRFALPYPAGTNFTSITYDGIANYPVSPVNTLADLTRYTYFYDDSAHLLWIHLQPDFNRYRYDHGHISLDTTVSVTVVASCPSHDCTQAIDPNSVTAQDGAPPAGFTLCETQANALGGTIQFTPAASGASLVIFDEQIDSEWNQQHYSWIAPWAVDSDIASSGSNSLEVYMLQQAYSIWRINSQKSFPASDYTHFEFKVRSGAGRGQINLGVIFQNKTGQDLDTTKYGVNNVNDPKYCANCPVDDTQWYLIRIPIADLGLGANLYNEIWSFRIWPSNWEYINTTVYFDEIKFTNGMSSFSSKPHPTSNIDTSYDYATDPYTLNPNTNLAISGGAPPPPGSSGNVITNPDSATTGNSNSSSPSASAAWAVPVVVILAIIAIAAVIGVIILGIMYKKAKEFV